MQIQHGECEPYHCLENAFNPLLLPTSTIVLSSTHECKQMDYLVTVHLLF